MFRKKAPGSVLTTLVAVGRNPNLLGGWGVFHENFSSWINPNALVRQWRLPLARRESHNPSGTGASFSGRCRGHPSRHGQEHHRHPKAKQFAFYAGSPCGIYCFDSMCVHHATLRSVIGSDVLQYVPSFLHYRAQRGGVKRCNLPAFV